MPNAYPGPVSSPFDEELSQPRQRPGRRRALAGGAALLMMGALITRAMDNGHGPGPAHPTRTTSPSSTGASPAEPRPALVLGPRTVERPVRNCPSDAVCTRTPGLPDAALGALRRAFGSAVLVAGTSMLAQRAGRFDPDLVSRSITARSGDVAIVVKLGKPSAAQRNATGTHRVGSRTITFVDDVVPGFLVSISVSRPVGRPAYPLPPLKRLAGDEGLRTPD